MNPRYQARCDNQSVATMVGCHHSKVSVLVGYGLLDCLNQHIEGVVKYYATIDVLRRTADPKWQVRATQALSGTADGIDAPMHHESKKRSRGLSESVASCAVSDITTQHIVAQFTEALKLGPDNLPIPALLGDPLVARVLGFRLHDLSTLRREGFLLALNKGRKSAKKLHSREYILELAVDVQWLARATLAMNAYWRYKNGQKGNGGGFLGAA